MNTMITDFIALCIKNSFKLTEILQTQAAAAGLVVND